MNRAPILFRCDGNPETGYEPFYQCLIAASAMQRRRRGTHFLSNLDPLSLALPINRGGHEWNNTETRVGTPDDLDATLREIRRLNAAAVLVVAPDLSEDYLRELDGSGALVVVIDSEARLFFPNRLVLNPFLGVGRERYKHERGTQLLVGTRYAFVRPLIRRLRPLRAQEPAQPFRALVALGEDDDAGHTLTVSRFLMADERIARAVDLRSAAPSASGRDQGVRRRLRRTSRCGDRRPGTQLASKSLPLRRDRRRRAVAGTLLRRRAATDVDRR